MTHARTHARTQTHGANYNRIRVAGVKKGYFKLIVDPR